MTTKMKEDVKIIRKIMSHCQPGLESEKLSCLLKDAEKSLRACQKSEDGIDLSDMQRSERGARIDMASLIDSLDRLANACHYDDNKEIIRSGIDYLEGEIEVLDNDRILVNQDNTETVVPLYAHILTLIEGNLDRLDINRDVEEYDGKVKLINFWLAEMIAICDTKRRYTANFKPYNRYRAAVRDMFNTLLGVNCADENLPLCGIAGGMYMDKVYPIHPVTEFAA